MVLLSVFAASCGDNPEGYIEPTEGTTTEGTYTFKASIASSSDIVLSGASGSVDIIGAPMEGEEVSVTFSTSTTTTGTTGTTGETGATTTGETGGTGTTTGTTGGTIGGAGGTTTAGTTGTTPTGTGITGGGIVGGYTWPIAGGTGSMTGWVATAPAGSEDSTSEPSGQKVTTTEKTEPTDSPPVLASIGQKNVNENQTLKFAVKATDPDGNAITYRAAGLPIGASFDRSTGEFVWKTRYGDAGSYSVTFEARANGKTDSEEAIVVVKAVDQPPTAFAVSINGTAEIGGTLIGSYIYDDENGDAEAGSKLEWLASETEEGAYQVIATADNTLQIRPQQAHKYIKFRVTPANVLAKGPSVQSAAVQVQNIEPIAIEQKVMDVFEKVGKNIRLTGLDDDGDSLVFSICKEPLHGVLTDFNAKTGDVTYTPASNKADRFRFSVNDGMAESRCEDVAIAAPAKIVSTAVNTDYAFKSEDFNKAAAIEVTELGMAGTLKLNGEDVRLNQRISKADIDAGRLKFTPARGAKGKDYARFQYRAFDGTALSKPAYTITIDVK